MHPVVVERHSPADILTGPCCRIIAGHLQERYGNFPRQADWCSISLGEGPFRVQLRTMEQGKAV
jgi:hypothetical protein